MNNSKLFLATGMAAGLVAISVLAGCGKPPVVTNPEIKPTKAVLGDPNTMHFKGKTASGAPINVPGQGIPPTQ